MKPKYIFSAVFTICVLMVTVLPQVARPGSASAVANAAENLPSAAENLPSAAEIQPGTAGDQVANAPTQAPPPAIEEQPASAQSPPTQTDNLPSPADQNAAPGQGLATIPETSGQPELEAFIASVRNGVANRLSGVYVPGLLALPIVQQPAGDANFVDGNDGTATEYARSAAYNVVGLLAHNTLSSGKSFFNLQPGHEVILIYGDGRQARYRIDRIENYQALGPNDPFSDFVDLNGPGGNLVKNEALFQHIYTNAGQLVFQTCFEANGNPSWGRMFVIANPM